MNGLWAVELVVCGCHFISVAGCLPIRHDGNCYPGPRQVNVETLPAFLVPLSSLFPGCVCFHCK